MKSKSKSKTPPVNLALARKVLAIVSQGLSTGMNDGLDETGKPIPGAMCVEAAVAFALGEDHNDQPKCVAKVIADYKIHINDASGYKDNMDRANLLKRIAIAQLGSRKVTPKQFCAAMNAEIEALMPLKKRVKHLSLDAASELAIKSLANPELSKLAMEVLSDGDADILDAVVPCDSDDGESIHLNVISLIREDNGYDPKTYRKRIQFAVKVGIGALRRLNVPGVKLMDQLIKEGAL